jgi:hypothetical protein
MNKHMLRFTTLLVASAALLSFTGCSKNEPEPIADKAKDAYEETKDAVAQGYQDFKAYTFEKRTDLERELKARRASIEANISDLNADYSEANASASRKAAMSELKDADADYKQKLSALGDATADTWNAARDRASAAWDRLQAAYQKARASN